MHNLPRRADKGSKTIEQVAAKLARKEARKAAKKQLKTPTAAELGKCPHCAAELGEGGIRGHDCEGLREAVKRAASPALGRHVLDVEILAYTDKTHSLCRGQGYLKRIRMPSGARLVAVDDALSAEGVFATPSGKDCGMCKGATTVPMVGAAGEAGAVEKCPACQGSGKEAPQVLIDICRCAASRFAKAHKGEFIPARDRFHWLPGKEPPVPKDWRSPFEREIRGPVQAPAAEGAK